MAEISLIYRLSSDIEENPVKWEVDVLSIDSIISLKERIYEKVFKCDYANSIDAEDLKLWKVQINNKEGDFSRLVPRNMEGAKKLLKGAINDFWEAQPSKEFTHIIVDSPLLTAMKKIEQDQDENTSDYIIPKGPRPGGSHLKDLFHAKIIRKNDVLRIKREYNKISVHIQCRVTNFDDGILSVMLIDRNEEQKEGILLLEDLERWLLEHSLDAKDRPKKYDNPGDNIEIIRNRIWLGSIRMRRNYYINNQELENRYKDSASKSELKQDENLSEEFNRLDITEKKNQSTAKYIDDEEVLPISDDELFPRLETLSCKFWDAYCEDIPSISYVSAEMINGKPAIVAYVNIPKTPVELPAEFKGYPVFLDYGVIEDACDTSPVALMPGISISSTSACTLGALFKTENETETGKSFILTVKHGVGNTGDKVIQPGSIDAGKGYTICAEVTEYNYYGVIEHGGDTLFLDYAFCEVIPNGIASTSNTPIQCEICIDNTKDSLSGRDDKYDVYKVGKKTHSTEGWVSDMLQIIRHRKFGKVKTLVVKSHENSKKIGAPGDSGSPVFDKHNRLWGIIQGISACGSKAIVIPIHLSLQHVQRTFGVSFKLINK